MQTINYHGWTVSKEDSTVKLLYKAERNGKTIFSGDFSKLLDMIYERTYDLKTN